MGGWQRSPAQSWAWIAAAGGWNWDTALRALPPPGGGHCTPEASRPPAIFNDLEV